LARLEDKGNRGLPPPPAATRRGANPWKLSDTARKPVPPPRSVVPDLLEELIQHAPADEPIAEHEAPQEPGATRSRPGVIGLVIVLIAVAIVARVFFDARKDGDWVKFIGPLIAIAFIAHGWWRMRQRREARKTRPG
jgi:hypothetical protein